MTVRTIYLRDEDKHRLCNLSDRVHVRQLHDDANEVKRDLQSEMLSILPTDLSYELKNMGMGAGECDVMVIHNLPIDRVNLEHSTKTTNNSETCLLGFSSVVGGILIAETALHQPGLIQQIKPVNGFKDEASGRGVKEFPFHVENVYIKDAPTILCLFCIHGEAGVDTEFILLEDICHYMDSSTIETLKKPIYEIHSGDGVNPKTVLENSPIIDDMGNGWIQGRFYEEDRLFSYDEEGTKAIAHLHAAIVKAKNENHNSINLTPGSLLIFNNGVAKGRIGGVMHGRRGVIGRQAGNTNRWLQRVCLKVDYQSGEPHDGDRIRSRL